MKSYKSANRHQKNLSWLCSKAFRLCRISLSNILPVVVILNASLDVALDPIVDLPLDSVLELALDHISDATLDPAFVFPLDLLLDSALATTPDSVSYPAPDSLLCHSCFNH